MDWYSLHLASSSSPTVIAFPWWQVYNMIYFENIWFFCNEIELRKLIQEACPVEWNTCTHTVDIATLKKTCKQSKTNRVQLRVHYSGVKASQFTDHLTDCLFQSLFQANGNKSKLCITGPLWWETTGHRWIPVTYRASNGDSGSMPWRHQELPRWPRWCCRSKTQTSSRTSDHQTGSSGYWSHSYFWWWPEGATWWCRRTWPAVSFPWTAHIPRQRYKCDVTNILYKIPHTFQAQKWCMLCYNKTRHQSICASFNSFWPGDAIYIYMVI